MNNYEYEKVEGMTVGQVIHARANGVGFFISCIGGFEYLDDAECTTSSIREYLIDNVLYTRTLTTSEHDDIKIADQTAKRIGGGV